MTVLLADECLEDRDHAQAVLVNHGITVLVAANGHEAWHILQNSPVDVVVAEIPLEGKDGYRLCQAVRSDPRLKDLPFIILTSSYQSPSDQQLSVDLGADLHLLKPIADKELVLAVESAALLDRTETVRREGFSEAASQYTERLATRLEEKNLELAATTEKMLLQSTALETAANAVVITDSNGVVQWVNPAFCALTGYQPDEVIGGTPRILNSGFHSKEFYKEFWSAIRSGKTWRGEFVNRRKDGTVYFDEHTVTPVKGPSGDITHFVGIMHDVTERKRSEEELRRTHEQLHQLLAHSPAVIYAVTVKSGKFTPQWVSDNMKRLLGVEPEESTFDWLIANIHPDDIGLFNQKLAETQEHQGHSFEYRVRHVDGSYRWIQDNARYVRGQNGEVVEVIGVWTDFTDKQEAVEALRQSEEHFRSMLDNVRLIAMNLDEHGRVTYCNPYLLELTGWTMDEAMGSNWFDKFVPESAREIRQSRYANLLAGDLPIHVESVIQTRTGEIREVEWNYTLINDRLGRPIGVASIGLDVTDSNRASKILNSTLEELETRVNERTAALAQSNMELKVAKELADIANHAKSEFLSRMSHELRTPMNAILGFGQLLELSELDTAQRDSLNHILKAGRHLLGLIDDILEISRIEIGSFGMSLETVELGEVLTECIDLMRPIAEEREIDLELVMPEKTFVTADRQRLRQVLLNLLSNGTKYNKKNGRVTLSVIDSDEESVTIEVKDTGIGIPEALLERLFTPFDRLGAEVRGIEGTGLGLSLSKSLTQAMGGTLLVQSKEGVGSSFKVKIKRAESIIDRLEPQRCPDHFVAQSDKRSKVLLIEDNLTNAELIRRLFQQRPAIELLSAMQGRLGLELAAEHLPDAVLLDLHLPDISGREVLVALRAHPELKNVPVIVISADAFPSQSDWMMRSGAFRYLTKPFKIDDLLQAVDEALGRVEHAQ